MLCIVYPNDGQWIALNVDYGLHGRGATREEAKQVLLDSLNDMSDLAREKGRLEDFLNMLPIKAAKRQYSMVRLAAKVASWLQHASKVFRSLTAGEKYFEHPNISGLRLA